MPLFPSDFKKFKHVSTDKDSTTLKHPAGHTITIAHSALSGNMRKQLEALIPKEAMADGGYVAAKKKGYLGSGPKVEEEVKEKNAPKSDGTKRQPIQSADSPKQKSAQSAFDEHMAKQPKIEEPGEPLAEGGAVCMADGGPVDEETQAARQIYNQMKSGVGMNPFQLAKAGTADVSNSEVFGPNGEPPAVFDANAWAQARKQQSNIQEENVAKTAAEQQRVISQNQARTDAGLAPLNVPDVPTTPQPMDTQQMNATPNTLANPNAQAPGNIAPNPLDPETMAIKGYNQQLAGVYATSKAQQDLAKDQEDILSKAHDAQIEMQHKYENNFNTLDQERQALVQDVQNGHLDPEKFWDNHSKIASGIGMILAGFNPTNSPNAAINYLKFQMEQNLQAQKENLASKQSLLSANLKQFGNMQEAMQMTRIMQSDLMQNQLQQAAARAASPMAKAAAMEHAGTLMKENSVAFQKFATQRTVRELTASANQAPSKIPALLDAMQSVDPDKAKDLRSRFVPQVGFASTNEGAKDMREMKTTVDTVQQSVKRLREIAAKSGKSASPKLRAEAEVIRNTLIGRLRVPLTGPGAMSEGERKIIEGSIPDVTGMMSLDSSNKKKLDTLENTILNGYQNMGKANGLEIQVNRPQSTEMTQEYHQAALKWAKANPKDPKAQQILKFQGQ